MLSKFKNYINKEKLVEKQDRLLLGISGGPDSLTMFDLFCRIKDEFSLEIQVFHLDHCFRKEAEQEAEFVAELCRERAVKAIIKKYNIPELIEKEGFSPEEAARKVRLQFMFQIIEKEKLDKIALAHNKDDLVETVFLHMFRGTALSGLTGIDPVSRIKGKKIIHPLLEISRSEIEKYCQYRNLKPIRDKSNKETIYTRNKIRHNIIPLIEKQINPGLKDNIFQMAKILREEDRYLEKEADREKKNIQIMKDENKIELSLPELKKLSPVIRRRIIKQVIFEIKNSPKDIYYHHYQAVEDLILNSDTGKKLDFIENISIIKLYEKIIIMKGTIDKYKEDYCYQLTIPCSIKLPDDKSIKVEYVDKENLKDQFKDPTVCFCDVSKVSLPLKVRNRNKGDRFQPLGMEGSKKIKDFFIDKKIPFYKRENIPLIVDNKNRIVWIAGLRMDDRFKITDTTNEIIKLKLKENN